MLRQPSSSDADYVCLQEGAAVNILVDVVNNVLERGCAVQPLKELLSLLLAGFCKPGLC